MRRVEDEQGEEGRGNGRGGRKMSLKGGGLERRGREGERGRGIRERGVVLREGEEAEAERVGVQISPPNFTKCRFLNRESCQF